MGKQSKKNIACLLGISALMLLSGCEKYYLSLTDQNINVNTLASVGVDTPDKRQHSPPFGERIVMDWRIPKEILAKNPVIDLHVIYGNYTEKTFEYPISKRMGYVTYKDIDEEYAATKGIITYSAEIRLDDGTFYRSWKHQLWANLITVSDETNQAQVQTAPSEVDEEKDSREEDEEDQNDSSETEEESDTDEESHSSADNMSSFVESQSIQGSVTEIEDWIDEMSSDNN